MSCGKAFCITLILRAGKQHEETGTTEKGHLDPQKGKEQAGTGTTEKGKPSLHFWQPFLPTTVQDLGGRQGNHGILRRTSKRVKESVDKMRLPAVFRLSRSFWDDARNGTANEKPQFVLKQLTLMTAQCSTTKVELPRSEIEGRYAEWIAGGLLAQCRALVHLDLSGNEIGYHGAGSLAGVLTHCQYRLTSTTMRSKMTVREAQSIVARAGHCASSWRIIASF